jgi:hypothetical protein
LGNYERAYTADESFWFTLPGVNDFAKHNEVVTAFAKIIEKNTPPNNPDSISKLFNLDQMGQLGNKPWIRGDFFEAKINFDSQLLPTSGVYTDYA